MQEFYSGLAEILEVEPETITPDFKLDEEQWDSMAIISCVALIDEVYGQLVSGSALVECKIVADIQNLVSKSA
ncbi:acyl carrier protein [Acetobacter suratthaniensis]|uniref:Acyl carrier protein n=1 Tax=Acetobacter suratthaniensis TaxID=1502841 RepID=A0ABS3LIF0_9PROT|nr:acyl carrier protein [Acetobacter suratthaniensis]MBO1327383.1 acyl carrier protein [Acetobacter suratthaniensis]MCX2565004.1 acyl carrier protein [Acetobacter suratthaniensis]